MNAREYLTGQRFGRLLVLKEVPAKCRRYLCLCDCGNKNSIAAIKLKSGHTKSCGCLRNEQLIERSFKHGFASNARENRPPEYGHWRAMNDRCYNEKSNTYPKYGAKGITVCDEWRHDFPRFFTDMGPKPSKHHSLDRFPDNRGNYELGNVRWATPKEQGANKINSRFVMIAGAKMPILEACKRYNILPKTFYSRIRYGWAEHDALTKPVTQQRPK